MIDQCAVSQGNQQIIPDAKLIGIGITRTLVTQGIFRHQNSQHLKLPTGSHGALGEQTFARSRNRRRPDVETTVRFLKRSLPHNLLVIIEPLPWTFLFAVLWL